MCYRQADTHQAIARTQSRRAAEQLLIRGDVVHIGQLQFARPDWTIAFDVDQPKAAETRKRLLDMAVAERLLIAGMHLPFPGFGYVDRGR